MLPVIFFLLCVHDNLIYFKYRTLTLIQSLSSVSLFFLFLFLFTWIVVVVQCFRILICFVKIWYMGVLSDWLHYQISPVIFFFICIYDILIYFKYRTFTLIQGLNLVRLFLVFFSINIDRGCGSVFKNSDIHDLWFLLLSMLGKADSSCIEIFYSHTCQYSNTRLFLFNGHTNM